MLTEPRQPAWEGVSHTRCGSLWGPQSPEPSHRGLGRQKRGGGGGAPFGSFSQRMLLCHPTLFTPASYLEVSGADPGVSVLWGGGGLRGAQGGSGQATDPGCALLLRSHRLGSPLGALEPAGRGGRARGCRAEGTWAWGWRRQGTWGQRQQGSGRGAEGSCGQSRQRPAGGAWERRAPDSGPHPPLPTC